MERKRLVWKAQGLSGESEPTRGGIDPVKLVVELAPMEIRTLLLHFDDNIRVFDA